ncbi:TPA: hypothetical protein ACMDSI_000742 [Vibrio parahaemolyticus]|nr:hypothetical protein [Vibrio parahaemolyticus]
MANYDTYAEVTNDLSRKLVTAANYPLTVYEKRESFPENSTQQSLSYEFSDAEGEVIVKDFKSEFLNRSDSLDISEEAAMYMSSVQDLLDNLNQCSKAYQAVKAHNANSAEKLEWDGPSEASLEEQIQSAEQLLADIETGSRGEMKALGVKFKAIIAWIKVDVSSPPTFNFSSKEFALSNLKVDLSGTGEAYLKHKWLKCIKKKWGICYRWKTIEKWTRLFSVTLKGMKFESSVSAYPTVSKNTYLNVTAKVKRFRLDYKYLNKIPLEKYIDGDISKKPVVAFDVSEFKKSLPLIDSNVSVEQLDIRSADDGVGLGITFRF